MPNNSFVHAHVHTDYSALDGAAKIQSLVEKVVELKQPGIAITDHGNAQGTHELWKTAKDAGVNAILGQEFYVTPAGYPRTHKAPVFYGESGGEDKKERSNDVSGGGAYTHMTIWAENNEGKFNLFKLSTRAYLEGKYMKPRIDTELLSEHARGLIGTTGCPSGEIQTRLRLGQWDKAIEYASQMQDILGKDNYYCEIMDHGLEIERIVRKDLLRLAKELNIPLIATNDSHYVSSDQVDNHDHLLCISSGSTIETEKRFKFSGDRYYIKSSEEMRELFRDLPEACDNTLVLNERCNVSFDEGADLMPKFDVPQGVTDKEFLEQEVIRLIPERVVNWDNLDQDTKDSYYKQAEYECGVINLMGFASYFLVVSDFVQWAKDNGIAVGPGRGCVTEDTKISTPQGFKMIKDLHPGDEVYDQKGDIVIIPQTFSYPVEEELVNIHLEDGTSKKLTSDHKILIKTPQAYGENNEWVKAKDVSVGDKMILPNDDFSDQSYNEVISISQKPFKGDVYDFTVPTTHSYVTDSGIIHNSAGGCLVAFALSITELDPIKHGLIFERFLNPDRVSMPDIDIDFDDKRRGEVIEYVTNKYGQDKVSQIITYTMIKAKSAIKDATRILDFPYALGDMLSKKFPPDVAGKGMKLSEVYDVNHPRYSEAEEFREFVNKGTAIFGSEMCKRIIQVALGIEGFLRSTGIHAAGVLMSSHSIAGIIPLMDPSTADKETSKEKKKNKKDEEAPVLTTVTQYDYPTCESLGLLKMDFLGLRNLTVITDAINSVKANHNIDISLDDLIHSELDDKKTYELLQRGEASSVFQLESCLAGNSLIGSDKISELYEKWVKGEARDKIISIDLASGKRRKNKILNVVKSGIKPVYRLVLDSGRMIEATADHKFMTSNGWKRLGDINKEVDQLVVDQRVKSAQYYRECQDCQKQLSTEAFNNPKRCYSCSAKFHSNPSKEKSRKSLSDSAKKTYVNGRIVWNKGLTKETSSIMKETGLKISKALMGRNCMKENLSPEEYELWLQNMREKFSGEKNPMFGKTPHHAKGGYRKDLGHYVRSSWEADYARILNYLNISYIYEYKTFDLVLDDGQKVTYTPDFYLKDEDRYVEIKGFMRDLDKEKIEKVQSQHGISLEVVSKTEFAELQFKYKNLLEWECPSLPEKVNFESIKDISYVNEQMTYDISMEAPLNNFLANGIMVHNSGMRSLLKSMAPTEFNDIVAVLALYRPGPMGVDAHIAYADRKNGRAPITPIHPELEEPLKEILAETFGLIIYQEQIMQIAQKVAGYSLSQADLLRRAMGKKKKSELDKQEDAFLNGMKERGYSKGAFDALWNTLLPFADYAFNKSHSAGYALLSYVTAYLKAHYPEEYMAAVLTSVSNSPDKTAMYLNECKKIGIKVTPPNIMLSEKNYSPKMKQIIFGLNSVRGLGGQTVDDLLKDRGANNYDSIPSLLEHIPVNALNKKVFEGLIFGGALDEYGHTRRALEESLIPMLSTVKKRRNEQDEGDVSLFDAYEVDLPEINIPDISEYSKKEKLSKERHILGLYLSDHPLSNMGETLESQADRTIIDIINNPPVESSDFGAGEKTVIAGVVTSALEKTTKKGEKMLLATIEDTTGEIEVIAFPKTYKAMGEMIQDNIYKISGTVRNEEDRGISMIIDNYEPLEIDEETGKVPLWLKMYENETTEKAMKELKDVLEKSPGEIPVRLSLKKNDGTIVNMRLSEKHTVKTSPVFTQRLMALFGTKIFGKW